MTLNEVKQKVSLLEYIKGQGHKVKKAGTGKYRVNPCPLCNHNDNFTIFESSNSFNCFSMNKGGDILTYMQEAEHLSFEDAKKKLYELANIPLEEQDRSNKSFVAPIKKEIDTAKLEAINKFVIDGYQKTQNQENQKKKLTEYLQSRSIEPGAIEKYHLFISKEDGTDRVYIPILEDGKAISYIGRAIEKNASLRYKNAPGKMQPFNLEYIKQEPGAEQELLFICEGVFDAISIEQEGYKAIALNSTQKKDNFIEEIKENLETAKQYKYVIATDKDEAGETAKNYLQEELTKLHIINCYLNIPKEYKDVNEWRSNDLEDFKNIEAYIVNEFTGKTIDNYIASYYNELNENCNYKAKPTGFYLLDRELNGGLRPGLYILGAIPSLRKNYFNASNSGQHS